MLNNLWKKYSKEKFGFSPQVRIYRQKEQDYYSFCNSVGWRKDEKWVGYNDLRWTLDAPFGHLPWVQGRRMYLTAKHMRQLCFSSVSLASGEMIVSHEDTIISILSQKVF